MRPSVLIIAMSATILALPRPLPSGVDDASGAILGGLNSGLNGVLGSPDEDYKGECHYRHKEDIATCIDSCVAHCAEYPEGCNSCIRGCSSQYGCKSHHDDHHNGNHDGKKHHHDRPDRRGDAPNPGDGDEDWE
ncbi:uncharacterized protein GGS22DRAFT_196025 [Annulohypoxylon maeteangense]|uniref:uncharacterized protein n=1 Tax=Annulohypoxylon maeteangense TaxID=1927788 RepID=UPI0020089BBA|nr:uncharacterized protein GGS22DRAFT_196025 [Annulohypoxylon maeteangense]KAI0882327.1 hypothetical protein GGS22DRAFT_196025 [Annulohypoxylon maeteangense]